MHSISPPGQALSLPFPLAPALSCPASLAAAASDTPAGVPTMTKSSFATATAADATETRHDPAAVRVALWCPSRDGHLRYTRHLADALHALHVADAQGSTPGIALLSTRPSGSEEARPYPLWHVGSEIVSRLDFPSTLHWAADRIHRRLTLDRLMTRDLGSRPEVGIVHLQELYPFTAFPTLRQLHAAGKKIVFTLHNVVPHSIPFGIPPSAWHLATARYLQSIDAIIVHSEDLRTEAIGRYRLAAERVHAVPHGIWHDSATDRSQVASGNQAGRSMSAADQHTAAADTKPDSGERRIRLLAFGQIRRNKGLHHLLEALDGAPPDWELVVAGGMGERDYWDQTIAPRIEHLRQSGRQITTRTDWIAPSDVPGIFSSSDIVVLPYEDFHAQSGVLFDAIAHRLPVVTGRGGTLGRTVEELGIGVLAESLAPQALRSAINAAAGLTPGELSRGWSAADDRYSWNRAAQLTAAVYRQLIALAPEGPAGPGAR